MVAGSSGCLKPHTHMQETTSMDVAKVLGRNHGNFLISLRRIEAKTGHKFTPAMRTVYMKHGFSKKCPYFKLTLDDCRFIESCLTRPKDKEVLSQFISSFASESTRTTRKTTSSTREALAAQPRIELFRSDTFGELHVTFDTQLWYCLTDICRSLELLIKEGERIIRHNGSTTKEFLVKKMKRTAGEIFVNYDGLLSLIIESKKTMANPYRKWVSHILPTKSDVAPAIVPDCYPTLDEYFTLYVPAPEFHEALSEVNAHCLTAAGRSGMKPEKRRALINDVNILNTFCDTLKAVYQLA